jgi:hypothetical protein
MKCSCLLLAFDTAAAPYAEATAAPVSANEIVSRYLQAEAGVGEVSTTF